MIEMTQALSDISRTNQLRLTETPKEIAEKLYLYLFKMDKGIESFSANDLDLSKYEDSSLKFYQKRHRAIKHEIKKRFHAYGEDCKYSDIRYFLSYFGGKNMCFFLSPNKTHSGWKQLFSKDRSNRERILNLIFKVHILIKGLSVDTINGFEELLLIHSISQTKDEKGIVVWGQKLFINYNHHDVLTLTLSRKRLLFFPKSDPYETLDGEEMGEVLLYKKQNYFFSNELDGRGKNSIKFMRFDKEDEGLEKFQKTQLYHYQNLMTKLEQFLESAGIAYESLPFQADHYLQNRFIKNIDAVEHLEIINNFGIDFTQSDKQFLEKLLKKQGVSTLSFFNGGKTISIYECEENACWKIQEVIPWTDITLTLDINKNYLVFNKILDKESGSSMAYQYDGFWYPTTEIDSKPIVDFYSQLKKKINYLETGSFISIQGVDVTEFRIAKNKQDKDSNQAILVYSEDKSKEKIIPSKGTKAQAQLSCDNNILNSVDSILPYMTEQQNYDVFEKFCRTHKVKLRISPEFQKVLIELGIKNWIRNSLVNPEFALSVNHQSFSEKRFFAIYVRKPRKQKAKAVAVDFLYKDGNLSIKNVLRDVKEIEKQFRPIFRKKKNEPKTLLDNQQYFVDEDKQVFISCYTDNFFTPTLIGRENIINEFEAETLVINRRQDNKFLPLVSYYSDDIKPANLIQKMICLDLHNEKFLQYYVPSAKNLEAQIKRGYRVYHLLGKTYSGETIPTSELINHPITSLHFSTLTQNILKISDNSQSSLLQKVAKIFIEN